MSLTVSILGCGWLGFPLASRLVLRGFKVKGSTTEVQKLSILTSHGIQPYVLNLNPTFQQPVGDFFESDVLVLTLPFRRDFIDPTLYQKQCEAVINAAQSSVKKPRIIFTSSTVVYPNDGAIWDEQGIIKSENQRTAVLLEIEQSVLRVSGTVLRCAGLYGPERELHRFMLKAALLKSAQGVMNLIHRDDACGVIEAIIDQQVYGQVINAVSDKHPTRYKLYQRLCERHGLVMPNFDDQALQAKGKIVSNEKLKRMLKYTFLYPDPMGE